MSGTKGHIAGVVVLFATGFGSRYAAATKTAPGGCPGPLCGWFSETDYR